MKLIHKGSRIDYQFLSVILDIDYNLNEGCLARWIKYNQKVSMTSKKLQKGANYEHISKK